MVESRDSTVSAQDFLATMKFWHFMAGLYLWEFVTTLDFEWSVIRGHRPYCWTIVIYSATRVATLVAVIMCLVGSDYTAQVDCQVEIVVQFVFGYLAIAGASLLIVLRVIAIWNRNKFIIAIAASVWATGIGFLIHSVMQIRAMWAPEGRTCMVVNIQSTKLNMIVALITDIILLLIMLIGLLRLGFHESGMQGLGHLMWTQGLVWLFLATIAYVPPVVLLSLDLNDSLNIMFQPSAMITTSIAATRVYRSLADFFLKTTEIAIVSDIKTSKINQVPAQPILLETFEATVHETHEQHQTPRNSQYSSSISGEGSLRDKPTGLGLDYDMERGAESGT